MSYAGEYWDKASPYQLTASLFKSAFSQYLLSLAYFHFNSFEKSIIFILLIALFIPPSFFQNINKL